MYDMAKIVGWTVLILVSFSASRIVLRIVNARFISGFPEQYREWVSRYRLVMKLAVKLHKPAGALALVVLAFHSAVMFNAYGIVLTGVIAETLLLTVAALGIYGAVKKRNLKSAVLRIHRGLTILLVLAIIVHLSFK